MTNRRKAAEIWMDSVTCEQAGANSCQLLASRKVSELIKIDRKKLTKFDQIQLMKYSHYIIDPCLLK